MNYSLSPGMRPQQHMHTVTLEQIQQLGEELNGDHPGLEQYFSPSRKDKFVKDYLHFLNTNLLQLKQRDLTLERYLVFVFSFQFIAPLLEIPAEKELRFFYQILEQRYEVEDLDINVHFVSITEDTEDAEKDKEDVYVKEEKALASFLDEISNSFSGKRDIKEKTRFRVKRDGIISIMKWQHTKGFPELAEAFGRSVVIPAFFDYSDKKLVDFYRRNTRELEYEVALPDFELS